MREPQEIRKFEIVCRRIKMERQEQNEVQQEYITGK